MSPRLPNMIVRLRRLQRCVSNVKDTTLLSIMINIFIVPVQYFKANIQTFLFLFGYRWPMNCGSWLILQMHQVSICNAGGSGLPRI